MALSYDQEANIVSPSVNCLVRSDEKDMPVVRGILRTLL